jgi:hypothetical protein
MTLESGDPVDGLDRTNLQRQPLAELVRRHPWGHTDQDEDPGKQLGALAVVEWLAGPSDRINIVSDA